MNPSEARTRAEEVVSAYISENMGSHAKFTQQQRKQRLIDWIASYGLEQFNAGVEVAASETFMRDHNNPKGRCEDEDGQIVCGCENLAKRIRSIKKPSGV